MISLSARRRDGFTLMEALVALAILAIAGAGLVGATEAHIDQVRGLQNRVVAQWVAENRMTELSLRGGTPTDSTDRVDMLGRSWRVDVAVKPSEDPDLSMVSIGVTPVGARGAAAKLTGFVDRQGGSA
ncbi:type II secretion system minor pseudopilin GspI [Brevundimonas sp.]|uniref:type II secretion system minor pseudopilin GspI n=1 Tax=Brevundimonas sp. TaxID=1871086 RepID=UPI001A22AE2A|nr:type II secretion system minor pseudopilin GspI [Brevundimonas sp.]MBJ7484977.1 type II secretion system minor pseudopilin GspI [Brevundimonas sp.]